MDTRAPSILVFCPVFDRLGGQGGQDAGISGLMCAATARYLDDVSRDPRCTVLIQNHNPHTAESEPDENKRKVLNHRDQFRAMRETFLAGNYTHVLIIESDMHPHPDTVDMLLACDSDAAYAPYMFRYGNGKSCNILTFRNRDDRNVGEPLTARGDWRRMRGIVDCSGSGWGVTMYRRRVLERIRPGTRDDKPYQFCDWWFVKTIWDQKHFTSRANLDCIAGHEKSDGDVLWPPWLNLLAKNHSRHAVGIGAKAQFTN